MSADPAPRPPVPSSTRCRPRPRVRVSWAAAASLGLTVLSAGCRVERPDVPGDAARLTGVAGAIVYRDAPDPHPTMPAAGETLTVDRAVRLALSRDPRVQASLARVRVAEADANQARLLPNPILALDVRFPVSDPGTAFEPALAADLVSLLQKPAQISAADRRLRASAAAALTTVLDVMAEVQQAYAAAASADAEIDNAERRLQRLGRVRDLAARRLSAGEATRLDVLTVDAQLMAAQVAVEDLKLVRTTERLTLARLLGDAQADVGWAMARWDPPADVGTAAYAGSAAESAWVDAALAHRPEVAAKGWELRALGDDAAVAGLAPLQGGDVGVHGERDPGWRVGPTLTTPLPIFDFGQASRAKAEAARVAGRHELAQQQQEVIQDVRTAYATYAHARRALADLRDKLLPLQQRQTDQAQLAYRAGEADLSTLLLAQNDLEQTLSNVVELGEKVVVARVKLQRAAGGAAVADRVEATAVPATMPATQTAETRPIIEPPVTTQLSVATQPLTATRPSTGPEQ
jgi:outer membrane protein TolC